MDRVNADNAIVSALREGYLSLFIGSGVSKSATSLFKIWSELVRDCCNEASVFFDDSQADSNSYLRGVIQDIEDKLSKEEYIELVKKCLYKDIVYDNSVLKKDLLVSLGSLVMGSFRGSASSVINYNFDDLLEWYLCYHGFSVQTISEIPTIVSSSDVTIYHPHGFLPLVPKFNYLETSDLIFSARSFKDSTASEVNPWNELQRSILGAKFALFVGMSGDDPHVEILCFYAYEKLLRRRRIVGIIILTDNADNRKKERELIRNGVVPYYIHNHDDLPDTLLHFCRLAADL